MANGTVSFCCLGLGLRASFREMSEVRRPYVPYSVVCKCHCRKKGEFRDWTNEHIDSFTKKRVARRDLVNRASPVDRAHTKRPSVMSSLSIRLFFLAG